MRRTNPLATAIQPVEGLARAGREIGSRRDLHEAPPTDLTIAVGAWKIEHDRRKQSCSYRHLTNVLACDRTNQLHVGHLDGKRT